MEPEVDVFARLRRFSDLVQGDPAATPLDLTALSLASVLRASADVDGALATMDRLAAGCPRATFEGLRRYLYDDLGFGVGGREPHPTMTDEPEHSFLDVVLARRTGLPILLATVVMEVGRRLGVAVVGVNMPMHFLVRPADDDDLFLDPVAGRATDAAGARAHFERLARDRVAWSDRHLGVVPNRHVVIRMLTNLQAGYQRRADVVQLALVARMRAAIPELAAEHHRAARLGAVLN